MIRVAVGVIKRADFVYVTYRHANQHQGEKWEFPGGKIEKNETAIQALKRELFEEVGIVVIKQTPLTVIEFDYSDKQVGLDVFVVDEFNNEPHPKESQPGKWIKISELDSAFFPEANVKIIKLLQSSS